MIRVRISRAISRRLLRSEAMVCSEIAARRHWSERYVDALFLVLRQEHGHCAACLAWESATAPDPMAEHRFTPAADVAGYRRAGWL